jgi:hypothetical protein
MARWHYTKGLHEIGNGIYAWLQPDGGLGLSNAGLIVDGERSLLVGTLMDLPLTHEMLDGMRRAAPAAARIDMLVNTRANLDPTFGNQFVERAEIIASEACAKEMLEEHPKYLETFRNWQSRGVRRQTARQAMAQFNFDGIVIAPTTRTFGDPSLFSHQPVDRGRSHRQQRESAVPRVRRTRRGDGLHGDASNPGAARPRAASPVARRRS